MRANTEHKVD